MSTLNSEQGTVSRRLINAKQAAGKLGCSWRHWLRLCDGGAAPFGVKLGALRRWDETELDEWIRTGCQPVRRVGAK